MMLAFVGGYLADRYNRWVLMFAGYGISALCYITYGSTANLTLFLGRERHRGLGYRLVLPCQAGLLRAGGTATLAGQPQGIESSAVQVGALVGTLLAPSSTATYPATSSAWAVRVLAGLLFAGPILYREWRRLQQQPERRSWR